MKTYAKDPRNIARKPRSTCIETGIADTSFMGPELEFFIFDDVQYRRA